MGLSGRIMWFLVLLLGCAFAAPSIESVVSDKQAEAARDDDLEKDDLKTAPSNSHVSRRFSDWGSPSGYNGYSVTGYGTLDDKYSAYYSGGGGYGGYDSVGYSGYPGYSGNAGFAGNGYSGSPGYAGSSGYAGNAGYGGYKGYGGGYGLNSGTGSGYGGYGGNGGLNSYYGYNNPNYQGAYHLGYGYNKRPGYGNIYSSGVTPSLVTGYRGYSRR